ncbi:MAG: tRNA 4-thiouridine(8) synthase ThiI [Mycoplasmataceae bacterium]|jgi:thiamine biosynthesis protein ThiI|nr:tRNA 4-thiouridine(8) synthase ThiI [Mycoplasmataceae bacterium]
MTKIIYIKYGELTLKGKNKMQFINCMFDSVKKVLVAWQLKITKHYDSILISAFSEKNYDQIIDILKKVPGINLIIPAYVSTKPIDSLSKDIIKVIKDTDITLTTFKVIGKRLDKSYKLNSMDLSKELGGILLDAFSTLKVDVHKPSLSIYVEIRKDDSIFYFSKIKGCGGFPLGINGRILMLISGGIDSPVASYLMMKKGFHVDFLTFVSPPHTDERALDKVRTLKKILTLDNTLERAKLYVVNFTKIQHEISHIQNHSYQITIMRRYFFRIAKFLCEKYGYDAIATGEALGQVASQTIHSMQTISASVPNLLIMRPLLTYDKSEIIELAKQIGTYETSILPFADSCSLFVPTNPATRPTIHTAASLEESLELINDIYDTTLNKYITIE